MKRLLNLLRKPKPTTCSDAGKRGAMVRKANRDAEYKAFHNDMADKAGTKIRWAR